MAICFLKGIEWGFNRFSKVPGNARAYINASDSYNRTMYLWRKFGTNQILYEDTDERTFTCIAFLESLFVFLKSHSCRDFRESFLYWEAKANPYYAVLQEILKSNIKGKLMEWENHVVSFYFDEGYLLDRLCSRILLHFVLDFPIDEIPDHATSVTPSLRTLSQTRGFLSLSMFKLPIFKHQ